MGLNKCVTRCTRSWWKGGHHWHWAEFRQIREKCHAAIGCKHMRTTNVSVSRCGICGVEKYEEAAYYKEANCGASIRQT